MSRNRDFSQNVATFCFLAFVAIVAVCAFTQCSPAACARYGALEAEYWQALDDACGDLKEVECKAERPGAVQAVNDEYEPKFLEAEKCRDQ